MNWQFFERLAEAPRSTPTVHAVGLLLAIRAKRDDPTCNPSIRSICKYAGVGMTGAVQAVRRLEDLGLIRREKRRGRSTIYHLNTVRESVTEVFGRATPERENTSKGSLVQEDDVGDKETDPEVPY